MLKLYKVTRRDVDYEQLYEVLVGAESEAEARSLAAQFCRSSNGGYATSYEREFLDPQGAVVEEIQLTRGVLMDARTGA